MVLKKFQIYAAVALLAVTHASCATVGWQLRAGVAAREAEEAATEALEQAKVDAKAARDAETVTQDVSKEVATATTRVEYVTREIIKEVPVYVTEAANTRCDVPDGFVRLHDAAATGNPPIPFGPGESADGSSGVELSTVAATVVGNYGICNVLREQVIGWQSWYNQVKDLWSSG